MPYVSDAQRRYFNANRQKLEAQGVDVDEWNQASAGRKLPERANSKDATMQKEALAKISRYLDHLAHLSQRSNRPLHVKQASCDNLIKLSQLLHKTGDLFGSLKTLLPDSTEPQRAKLAYTLARGAARFAKQANNPAGPQVPGMGPAPRAGQWRNFLPQTPMAPASALAPVAAKPPMPAAAPAAAPKPAAPKPAAPAATGGGLAGQLGGFMGGLTGLSGAGRGLTSLVGNTASSPN